jgi:hypothetical protein
MIATWSSVRTSACTITGPRIARSTEASCAGSLAMKYVTARGMPSAPMPCSTVGTRITRAR